MIYYKELTHTIMETRSSNTCRWQAGDTEELICKFKSKDLRIRRVNGIHSNSKANLLKTRAGQTFQSESEVWKGPMSQLRQEKFPLA